jgi:hypothetical protein
MYIKCKPLIIAKSSKSGVFSYADGQYVGSPVNILSKESFRVISSKTLPRDVLVFNFYKLSLAL